MRRIRSEEFEVGLTQIKSLSMSWVSMALVFGDSGEMDGIGTALPGFSGLRVVFDAQHWAFLLRRADFSPDDGFGDLHNAPVRAREVIRYLPNWAKLDWVPIPDNLVTRSESKAQDLPYQVNIHCTAGSGLTHEDVIDAFRAFMAQPVP